jgi:hypothetical protein
MARLAESDPALAARFIAMPGGAGRLRALRDVATAGANECLSRLLAPVARRRWPA